MRPRIPALAALFLLACDPVGTPVSGVGLSPELQGLVAGCSAAPGAAGDWCVVHALKGKGVVETTAPAHLLELCRRLDYSDAHDACVEFAVTWSSGVQAESCDEVRDPRMRASCRLAVADRVINGGAELDEQIDACSHTSELVEHCLVHIVKAGEARWAMGTYAELMGETGRVLAQAPEPREMLHLGSALGDVSGNLVESPEDGPCEFLPDGGAYSICTTRHHQRRLTRLAAP